MVLVDGRRWLFCLTTREDVHVDHLKLGIATPDRLVDVTRLTSAQITQQGGGQRTGAAVRKQRPRR